VCLKRWTTKEIDDVLVCLKRWTTKEIDDVLMCLERGFMIKNTKCSRGANHPRRLRTVLRLTITSMCLESWTTMEIDDVLMCLERWTTDVFREVKMMY